jgi:hypothetical protein
MSLDRRFRVRLIRPLLYTSAFLCFLGTIWSNDKIQWGVTGLYVVLTTRYILGVFSKRDDISLENLIERRF